MKKLATKSNELTKEENIRRATLERTIKNGQGAFIAVGNALTEMRDSKLYRNTHKTFEAYCADVWGWTKQHAYRLIEASGVVKSLPKKSNPLGYSRFTERQMRALAAVPEEHREEVLAAAGRNGEITSAAIREAAEMLVPKDITDELDNVVPDNLREDWIKASRVGKEIQSAGRAWKHVFDGHLKEGEVYQRHHGLVKHDSDEIGQLIYNICSKCIPYAVCPTCRGKKCKDCYSRGWLGRSSWQVSNIREGRHATAAVSK